MLVQGRASVAVNSGTSGLHLGLLAAGIGPGDEVIVPSFTFAATANSVALTGATPVFADIEPEHVQPRPALRSRRRSPSARPAIMPVHLYGHPAHMTELGELAERRGLALFEDAAQAHGASLERPHRSARSARFAMFSLYPTKNMTSGEGGMVALRSADELVRAVKLLRNQGMETQYAERGRRVQRPHDRHPRGHRPGAADQGRRVDRDRGRRTRRSSTRTSRGVVVPPVADGAVHVYHQYTIRVPEDRDGFVAALKRGVPASAAASTTRFRTTGSPSLAPFAPGLELQQTERAARRGRLAAGASVAERSATSSASSTRVNARRRRRAPDGRAARRAARRRHDGRHHARVLRELPGCRPRRHRRSRRRPARRRRRPRRPARRRGADRRGHRHRGRRDPDPLPLRRRA